GPENLVWLEVIGNKDVARQSQTCSVSRYAVGKIASGGATKHREPQLHVARGSNGNDAIFVREGRMIDGVVLDVQLRQSEFVRKTFRLEEGLKPRVKAGLWRFHGEQFEVAPERRRPRLDDLAAHHLFNRGVVVRHFKRPQAFGAHPERLCRIRGATQVTRQS